MAWTVIADDIPYGRALENAIALVRGKWASAVLVKLAAGPLRVGDLLDEINNSRTGEHDEQLSYKVLNDTLKHLVEAGLVTKHREPANFAAKSWYELTIHGKTFLRTSRSLVHWYHSYLAAFDEPQDGRPDHLAI